MLPIGILSFCLLGAAIFAYKRKGPRRSAQFGMAILFVQSMPSAVLFAPLIAPASLFTYGVMILAWMGLLALTAFGAARIFKIAPPVAAAALCIVFVIVDTLLGQPLLKDSVFSAYALSGIRYYGVGNEYLGIVVGFAIMGVFSWMDDRGLAFPAGPRQLQLRWAAPVCWTLLAFLLGWPTLGANAGSLIVTAVGFGVASAILYGRKPSPVLAAFWGVAGLVLAFVFGALEATFAEATSSHMGQAIRASTSGRGPGYLMDIIVRKIDMNFHLLFSPWLLLAAAAVIVTAATARRMLGKSVLVLLSKRRWTAAGHYAVFAALITGLLFKDSGVVLATYLAGTICVMDLYYLLSAPAAVV